MANVTVLTDMLRRAEMKLKRQQDSVIESEKEVAELKSMINTAGGNPQLDLVDDTQKKK